MSLCLCSASLSTGGCGDACPSVPSSAGRKQFARHEWAQKAAYLLGVGLEELSSSIFKHQAKGSNPRISAIRQATEDAADSSGTADASEQRRED